MTRVKRRGHWYVLVLAPSDNEAEAVLEETGESVRFPVSEIEEREEFYPSLVPEDQMPPFSWDTMMRERSIG